MLCVSVLQPPRPALTRLLTLLSPLAGHMEEGPDLDLGKHQVVARSLLWMRVAATEGLLPAIS